MQTIAALGALRQSGLDPRNCVLGISEPTKAGKRNGLREMLEKHQLPLLQHDTGVGGRYSALTNVGLLPAAILGLDIGAIRNGAGNALLPVLDKYEPARVPAALGAARSVALAESKGRWMSVLMAYSDRLQRFMQCTCSCGPRASARTARGQLRSQRSGRSTSTAKCNCSITGPRDKLFNVVGVGAAGKGPRMDAERAKFCGEPGFAGKTIGDLVAAEGRATAETLAKNGFPVRTFQSLGELLMHFMLETIIAARICLASTRSTSRRWERARCWRRSI